MILLEHFESYFTSLSPLSICWAWKKNTFRRLSHHPLLIPAPQRCVIPKVKAMLCLFSFGITKFCGAGINRGNTVYQYLYYFRQACMSIPRWSQKWSDNSSQIPLRSGGSNFDSMWSRTHKYRQTKITMYSKRGVVRPDAYLFKLQKLIGIWRHFPTKPQHFNDAIFDEKKTRNWWNCGTSLTQNHS